MSGLIYLDYQPSQMVIGAVLAAALALFILGVMAVWRPASAWLRNRRMRVQLRNNNRRNPHWGRVWLDNKEITSLVTAVFPPKSNGPR